MPVVQGVYEPYRSTTRELVAEKIEQIQTNLNFDFFAAVARVLTTAESDWSVNLSNDAQKALLDAYGSQPGFAKEQADARQACAQAIFTGVPTYLRLPGNRWPKHRQNNYHDPLVPMLLALYGHPDSGGIWERYFEENIGKNGWTPVLKKFGDMFSITATCIYFLLLTLMVSRWRDQKKSKQRLEIYSWSHWHRYPRTFRKFFGCEHRVEENPPTSLWKHDRVNKTRTRYHVYPRLRVEWSQETAMMPLRRAPLITFAPLSLMDKKNPQRMIG